MLFDSIYRAKISLFGADLRFEEEKKKKKKKTSDVSMSWIKC